MNNTDVLDYFSSLIEVKSAVTAKEYNKALAYLAGFLSNDEDSFVHPTAELIEDWGTILLSHGMSPKTMAHYIDNVAAMFSTGIKAGVFEPTDAFKVVKKKIKKGVFLASVKIMSEFQYNQIRTLAAKNALLTAADAMFKDLFVVSILSGCKPFSEIAMLKKEDIASQPAQIATILERHCDDKRKYVFNLSQSTRTPRQLNKYIEESLNKSVKDEEIGIKNTFIDLARNVWAFAAMKSGVSPADVYAILGENPTAIPQRTEKVAIKRFTGTRDEIIKRVGETFINNPINWYVMKLRPGTKFEELEKSLKKIEKIKTPELFYPALEIKKKVNKKKRTVTQPVIPGIVFFKSRATDVRTIFAKIGDLAWCFKRTMDDGQYAIISRTEMEQFQRTIGQFTPDYEVGPLGSITPQPGDVIKVVGGILNGNEGELLKVIQDPKKGVIYQLKITNDSGIEWKVGVDSRLTEKGE